MFLNSDDGRDGSTGVVAQPQRQAEVRLRMCDLWRPDRFGVLLIECERS